MTESVSYEMSDQSKNKSYSCKYDQISSKSCVKTQTCQIQLKCDQANKFNNIALLQYNQPKHTGINDRIHQSNDSNRV